MALIADATLPKFVSSPNVNLASGTLGTSIAIEVPPGRAEMTPKVALNYSSNAGASPYGYGWSLSLGRIIRSERNGAPRYDDTDEFILELASGQIELVEEGACSTVCNYKPKVASHVPAIAFHRGQNYWKIIDPNGNAMFFGTESSDRIGPGNLSTEDGTYAWLLSEIRDPQGNYIEYGYLSGSGDPLLIQYGGHHGLGLGHRFFGSF